MVDLPTPPFLVGQGDDCGGRRSCRDESRSASLSPHHKESRAVVKDSGRNRHFLVPGYRNSRSADHRQAARGQQPSTRWGSKRARPAWRPGSRSPPPVPRGPRSSTTVSISTSTRPCCPSRPGRSCGPTGRSASVGSSARGWRGPTRANRLRSPDPSTARGPAPRRRQTRSSRPSADHRSSAASAGPIPPAGIASTLNHSPRCRQLPFLSDGAQIEPGKRQAGL